MFKLLGNYLLLRRFSVRLWVRSYSIHVELCTPYERAANILDWCILIDTRIGRHYFYNKSRIYHLLKKLMESLKAAYSIQTIRNRRLFSCPYIAALHRLGWLNLWKEETNLAKTKVIAFANQNGCVGKSTSMYCIGTGLAQSRNKVLLLNVDP